MSRLESPVISMWSHDFGKLVILALLFINPSGSGAPSEWFQTARRVTVGDTRKQVEVALQQFKLVDWNSLTNHQRLDFLRGQRCSAWLTGLPRHESEGYVVAVFSAANTLTDLLRFEPQDRVFPLVKGTYAERLRSIKKGMNVDELYRLIGATMPYSYFRDTSGKWRVRFSYQGFGPDFWGFDADAASGTILGVSVSSI